MFAFTISLILILILWILKKYTNAISIIMSNSQYRFIMISSLLYILLFGFILSLLMTSKKITDMMADNSLFIPLIFYIIWYISSASITTLFVSQNNYQGFFNDSNKYMSQRNIMP
jgi:hypothetical protein